MDGPHGVGDRARAETSAAWRGLTERLFLRARGGMVLGLERMEAVLSAYDHPERAFAAVHVAGSNGKGSTCAFLAAILSHGERVGLYTSPHLVSLTERIQIVEAGRGRPVSERELFGALDDLDRRFSFETLTFFELITAAGFVLFRDREVQTAIVEAGLGARLDATRTADAQVSVLTEIALEHTAILGDTVEAIAAEKAYVMRPGRPLVMASVPEAVAAVVDKHARGVGSQVYRLERDFGFTVRGAVLDFDLVTADGGRRQLRGARLALAGEHQRRNAALALQAALLHRPGLDDQAMRAGLAETCWPGRLERFEAGDRSVLLDGAHNPEAIESLVRFLTGRGESCVLVFGVLADKDSAPMLERLREVASEVVLTRPTSPRAREPQSYAFPGARVVERPEDAFAEAEQLGKHVVITGSLYLVGELRPLVLSRYAPAAEAD